MKGIPVGQILPTHAQTHTHDVGVGVFVDMGVGASPDTHGFTHDNPYMVVISQNSTKSNPNLGLPWSTLDYP